MLCLCSVPSLALDGDEQCSDNLCREYAFVDLPPFTVAIAHTYFHPKATTVLRQAQRERAAMSYIPKYLFGGMALGIAVPTLTLIAVFCAPVEGDETNGQ